MGEGHESAKVKGKANGHFYGSSIYCQRKNMNSCPLKFTRKIKKVAKSIT